MSIESTFLASNYLQNRLNGLSNSEAVSSVNRHLIIVLTDELDREFSIAASDSQYLFSKILLTNTQSIQLWFKFLAPHWKKLAIIS